MADLFLVMQTLVVIFENRRALLLPGVILAGRVDDVAAQDFLPEGKAPAGTCCVNWVSNVSHWRGWALLTSLKTESRRHDVILGVVGLVGVQRIAPRTGCLLLVDRRLTLFGIQS